MNCTFAPLNTVDNNNEGEADAGQERDEEEELEEVVGEGEDREGAEGCAGRGEGHRTTAAPLVAPVPIDSTGAGAWGEGMRAAFAGWLLAPSFSRLRLSCSALRSSASREAESSTKSMPIEAAALQAGDSRTRHTAQTRTWEHHTTRSATRQGMEDEEEHMNVRALDSGGGGEVR